jgi:hypothetical protein
MSTDQQQALIDQLQVALPRLQQIAIDVAASIKAIEQITALVQPVPQADPREQAVAHTQAPWAAVHVPRPAHLKGTTDDLQLAMLRQSWTTENLAHLSGIPAPRIKALAAGEIPTNTEHATLRHLVRGWKPVARIAGQ